MEWFEGDVGSAITSAKNKGAIFCVFITGEDEASAKLLELLNNSDLGSKFSELVCIRIDEGTPTFTQFSQLYPVLLVPSIFYVDSSSGLDIEVTVAVSDDKSILAGLERAREKLETMKNQPKGGDPLPTPDFPAQSADMESRVSRARDLLDENIGRIGDVASHNTPTNIEDRVERARRLMQQRKEQKEREDAEKEKAKERERRELGQTMQDKKRKQDEDNMKEMAAQRRKDKEADRVAKERVKAAIEQDRVDRAAKFNKEKAASDERRKEKEKKQLAEQAARAEIDAANRSSVARLQFRLPDGRSQTHQFPADTPISEVYSWVTTDLGSGFSRFSLATSFPRRDLDNETRSSTLKQLQLAPSATILVLPQSSALAPSDGSLMSYMMLLLSPFTFLFGLLSSIFNPPASNANPTANTRKEDGTARPGNIGRLRQSEHDDENNTYNGNSTQQQ